MHNGSIVAWAWSRLRTVEAPAPAAAVLTSGQAGLTKSDLSHQSSEASLRPAVWEPVNTQLRIRIRRHHISH